MDFSATRISTQDFTPEQIQTILADAKQQIEEEQHSTAYKSKHFVIRTKLFILEFPFFRINSLVSNSYAYTYFSLSFLITYPTLPFYSRNMYFLRALFALCLF